MFETKLLGLSGNVQRASFAVRRLCTEPKPYEASVIHTR